MIEDDITRIAREEGIPIKIMDPKELAEASDKINRAMKESRRKYNVEVAESIRISRDTYLTF